MNISYGNGEVYLDHDSKIVALQILFFCIIDIKSELPDGYQLYLANNKIIIFSMGLLPLPDLLFKYTGKFVINKVIASNAAAEKQTINIKNQYYSYWKSFKTTWDTASRWEDLKDTKVVGHRILKQKDIRPKLTLAQKNLVKRSIKELKKRTNNG